MKSFAIALFFCLQSLTIVLGIDSTVCKDETQKFPNPCDGASYYTCVKTGETWTLNLKKCDSGQYFDEALETCEPLTPFKCTAAGLFPNPTDNKKYYRCISISGVLQPFSFTCPTGSYFARASSQCKAGVCG